MQSTLVQLQMFEDEILNDQILSLSEVLVRISAWQENVPALKGKGVILSWKQLGSLLKQNQVYLSGKMLKEVSAQTMAQTFGQLSLPLPTLGAIDLNGNCLIRVGYYPKIESGYTLSDILQEEVSQEYFLSENQISYITKDTARNQVKIASTLNAGDIKSWVGNFIVNANTKQGYEIAEPGDSINFSVPTSKTRRGRVGKGTAQTLDTACNQGVLTVVGNVYKSGGQAGKIYDAEGISPVVSGQRVNSQGFVQIVKPVLTPDRLKKRQNGRRFKEDGEPAFTLGCQDQHGVMINNNIRRLTEIECERLQGFDDNWTEYGNYDGEIKKIAKTQRYKMIGNAVTVDIVKIIAERLKIT